MSEYPKQTGPHSWIVEVKQDGKTKELFLEFPPGCLDQVGWDIGDDLIWEDMGNGAWSLTKKELDKNA
jgi:hypothetical protein